MELEIDMEWDDASLQAAFAELEEECRQIVRGMTVAVWNGILTKTPQWAGGMAASWSYSLGSPQFYDRSNMVDGDLIGARQLDTGRFVTIAPLRRGHPAAIAIANADNQGSELAFRLGETVWIANGADHGEGYYAAAVEAGEVRLRAVNLPGAPVRRTIDQIGARFAEDVTINAAALLKQMRIGGNLAAADS